MPRPNILSETPTITIPKARVTGRPDILSEAQPVDTSSIASGMSQILQSTNPETVNETPVKFPKFDSTVQTSKPTFWDKTKSNTRDLLWDNMIKVGGTSATANAIGSINVIKDVALGGVKDVATDMYKNDKKDMALKSAYAFSSIIKGASDFVSNFEGLVNGIVAGASAGGDYVANNLKGGEAPFMDFYNKELEKQKGIPNYLGMGITYLTKKISEGQSAIMQGSVDNQTFQSNIPKESAKVDAVDKLLRVPQGYMTSLSEKYLKEYTDKKVARGESPDSTLMEQIAQNVPNLVGFIALGGVTRKFVEKEVLANLTNTVFEAGMEADQTRQSLLQQGKSEQEASVGGLNSFSGNIALIPISNKIGGMFEENTYKGVKRIMKYATTGAVEGGQEFAQQLVQNTNTNRPIMEGTSNSFIVGALMGMGSTAVFNTMAYGGDKLSEAVANGSIDKMVDNDPNIPADKKAIVKKLAKGTATEAEKEAILKENVTDVTKNNASVEFTDGTPEHTALVADVKTALDSGSRISAVQNAIVDQYNVSPEYANSIVQKALEVSHPVPITENAQKVERPTPPVDVEATTKAIADLTKQIPAMKQGSVEKKNAKIELETERAKLRTIKQQEESPVVPTILEPITDKVIINDGNKYVFKHMGNKGFTITGESLEVDGKVVGGIEYGGGGDSHTDIKFIEIKPEYRKKGYATKIIHTLMNDSFKKEIRGVATKDSFNFWKKLGATFSNIDDKGNADFILTKESLDNIKVNTPIDKVKQEAHNKTNEKPTNTTIQRTTRNNRRKVSKPVSNGTTASGETGKAPSGASEEVISGGSPNADSAIVGSDANGTRPTINEVDTHANPQAETDFTKNIEPVTTSLDNEVTTLKKELTNAPEGDKADIQEAIDVAEETKAGVENKFLDKYQAKEVTNEQITETIKGITSIDSTTGEVTIGKFASSQDVLHAIEEAKLFKSGGVTKEGRGILDEYYTDKQIVNAVFSLLDIAPTTSVLEPSVGIGNFVPTGVSTVEGYEINATTAGIAKLLNPSMKVYNKSFETNFIDERGGKKTFESKYDLVVGNPPYGEHRGLYKGLGEEESIGKYEDYFTKRGLDVVKEGGKVVFVIPSSFLSTQDSNSKRSIARLGKIEMAFRLPENAFDGTSIGTDIVVFTKEVTDNPTEIMARLEALTNDAYFKYAPNNVLGETLERKNRFGQLEYYVEGTIEDALAKMNALNIEKIAVGVAEKAGITPTDENIEAIKEVIAESESSDVTETVKEVEKQNEEAKKKEAVKTKKIVERIRKVATKSNAKQVNLQDVQTAVFTPEELTHWENRNQDGSLKSDFAHNPAITSYYEGKWYMDFTYLQGNIYEKLDTLASEYGAGRLSKEQYNKQHTALEAILPEVVPLERIKMNANSPFLKDFKVEVKGTSKTYMGNDDSVEISDDVTLADSFKSFIGDVPSKALGGMGRWDIYGYIDNKSVTGGSKDENARIRKYRAIVGNELFVQYLTEMQETDKPLAKRIETEYNKRYNATHIPDYSQVPLTITINNSLNGSPFEITSVQQQGVGRLVDKGVGILAHDVGFGKTLTAILAVQQNMKDGHTKKPLIIVPKATYTQWVNTILEVIPDAKVNNLYNLSTDYKGDLSSLKINEGEFNIVTEEGFKQLSFKDETYNTYASKYAYVTDDLNSQKTDREAEKARENSNENKGKMKRGTRSDLYFEDLGFDHIVIDEVHNANNIITKIKMPKGKATEFRSISKPAKPSQYGVKAWLASQYIQDNNNGKNVYLLSATPFTNSPLQYFSVLSLLANKTMKAMGVDNINDFLTQFMDTEIRLEYKANGSFSEKQVVRNFKNNNLLRKLLGEYIDFKDGEDNPDLIRPDKKQNVNNFSKSEDYATHEQEIQREFGSSKDTLKLIGQLRALSISSSLLKGDNPDIANYKSIVENSPKLYAIAQTIGNNQKLNREAGREATEIVYSPLGVEIFPILKQYLVKELGMKPEEISVITGDTKVEKRSEIQADFNKEGGTIKVLMGTDTIGTGMNLQKRTSDIHFLGLPYNFTDLIQVEGRGWRQGNKWRNIRMNHYLMENSYDALHFQILTSKQKRYELAIKNNEDTIDVGDVDVEKQLSELITDPNLIADIRLQEDKKKIAEELRTKTAELSYAQKKIDKIVKIEKELSATESSLARSKSQLADPDVSDYMKEHYTSNLESDEKEIKKLKQAIEDQKQAYIDNGIDIKTIYSKVEPLKLETSQLTERLNVIDSLPSKTKYLEDAKASVKPVVPFLLSDVTSMISAYTAQNKDFYELESRHLDPVEEPVQEITVAQPDEVSAQGEKTYYHGTLETFDTFDIKKAGANTGWENAKFGFFFTEHKSRASDFIETTRQAGDTRKGVVKEVHLDIKNPLDLTLSGIFNNEKQAPLVVSLLLGEKTTNGKKALKMLDENIGLGEIADMWDALYGDIANKKLIQKAGYDGIVSEFGQADDGSIIKEYVAFEASQITDVTPKEKKANTVKKITKKTTTAVAPELAIINDKSLSVTQKVEALLDKKQAGKEHKDVGERVSGSKKEKATIKAIYKYGGQDMFDEIVKQLGWEAVLETVDKAEILAETGASNTIQSDYDNKVPAPVAQAKKDILDTIYKVPKLAGKQRGKYNFSNYTYKIKDKDSSHWNSRQSANKEDLIAVAKVYPNTLKQFVNLILSATTKDNISNLLHSDIHIDALGNIVDSEDQTALYTIDQKALGIQHDTKWELEKAFRGKYDYEKGEYLTVTFDGTGYEKLLNPVKKDINKADDQHGNFEAIDKYDIGDAQVAKETVKAETLTNDYGFKSVQLGNYMDDESSYEHIQQTIGAMQSMSQALGIDFAKIIANKGLSIAFGARGGGKALAHYEPTANIINLTKKRGDGSLGHEFMHFLDFTASSSKGSRTSSLYSSNSYRYYRNDEAGRELMKALITGGYKVTKSFSPNDKKLDEIMDFYSERTAKEFHITKGDVASFIIEQYKTDTNLAGKRVTIDGSTGELAINEYSGSTLVRIEPQLLANLIGKEINGTVTVNTSKFRDLSMKNLGGGKESYWTKKEELLARAFEAYLYDKLEATGLKNNYAVRDNVAQTDTGFLAWAYPQGEERLAFNKLFDTYFAEVRSKAPYYTPEQKKSVEEKKAQIAELQTKKVKLNETMNNDWQKNRAVSVKAWDALDEKFSDYLGSEQKDRTEAQRDEYIKAKAETEASIKNTKEGIAYKASSDAYSLVQDQIEALENEIKNISKPSFKYKGDTISTEPTVTGSFLKDASERLKVNFDYKMFDTILGQMGAPAWGVTVGNTIGLEKSAPFITEPHEFVHLTLKNLQKIDALKHLNRDDILKEQTKKLGLPVELYQSYQVEEALAQGIESYQKGETKLEAKSNIKQLYDYLVAQFKKLLEAIHLSKGGLIKEYYDILLHGQSTAEAYTVLSDSRNVTQYITDNVLDLSSTIDDLETTPEDKIMLKKKVDEVKSKYDSLVKEITENQEMMSVISKYTDTTALNVIVEEANKQVSDYVKAILEIKNIKQEVDTASNLFARLVKNRENIEDLLTTLESKLVTINVKLATTEGRAKKTTVTVVADAIAQEENKDSGDTGEESATPVPTATEVVEAMTPKKTTAKEGKKVSAFQHRMMELLEEQSRNDVMYDVMHKIEEVAKAEAYYDANKKRVINMALGKEAFPEGVSGNVITLTVLEKAREAGDSRTIARVLPKLSLRATAQGQEISMLANAFGDKDPIAYLNKLIAQRKLLARKKYKPFFSSLDSSKGFETVVKEKVAQARKKAPKLSDLMTLKAEDIDNFLNDITC